MGRPAKAGAEVGSGVAFNRAAGRGRIPPPPHLARTRSGMAAPPTSVPPETLHANRQVHVIGAGPVGLLLTALLQPVDSVSVHLYEKRHEYTRKPDGAARAAHSPPTPSRPIATGCDRRRRLRGGVRGRRSSRPRWHSGARSRPTWPALIADWVVGLLPAEHDRAGAERAHRRARVGPRVGKCRAHPHGPRRRRRVGAPRTG